VTAPSDEEFIKPAVRGLAAAVVAAIIIGTLYFGREVFVPIALAILLSFVLAPLVRLLQRWHIPRGLSVISVVLLALPLPWRTSRR
jgi:predicted PurR-regulated permease PerM